MIAVLLLIAQPDQDMAAATSAPSAEDAEIVVQATYGITTMLFDKGADGRLRNCRIMVSSGSQRRDTKACQQTPVCYEKTRDTVTECVELSAVEPSALGSAPGNAQPTILDMPRLVQPRPAPLPGVVGPVTASENSDRDRQRVKLPPLPKDNSHEPAIRITTGHVEDR